MATKKIFTGQKILSVDGRGYDVVPCHKCDKPVSLQYAYYDPHNGEKYVHKDCLSEARQQEIAREDCSVM